MSKPYAIEVRPCRAIVVSGVNLQEGDSFVVHRVVDSSCDTSDWNDIPFSPCGTTLSLDAAHNPVLLDMPGRYRIYPTGVNSDTAELWFDEVAACGK